LGNRSKSRGESKLMPSDFHIPSATEEAGRMSKNQTRKEPSYFAYPSPPSGSSFDWKRLTRKACELTMPSVGKCWSLCPSVDIRHIVRRKPARAPLSADQGNASA